jgi:hypothetical protein
MLRHSAHTMRMHINNVFYIECVLLLMFLFHF